MREPRRLFVMSPNWLGDAVMALPAIADLRRAWPTAHLVVAARASVAAMFERVPGVDEVLTLTWTGKRDRPRSGGCRPEQLRYGVALPIPSRNGSCVAQMLQSAGAPLGDDDPGSTAMTARGASIKAPTTSVWYSSSA
jgi:hypothetical protein